MLIVEMIGPMKVSEVKAADRLIEVDGIAIGSGTDRPQGVLVEHTSTPAGSKAFGLGESRILTVWGKTTMFDIEVGHDARVRVLRTLR
jgi:hypothetical protein